jgi:hypothetical protein
MSRYTELLAQAQREHAHSCEDEYGVHPDCGIGGILDRLAEFDERDKSPDRPMADVLETLAATCPVITNTEAMALTVAVDCVRSVAAMLTAARPSPSPSGSQENER